MTIFTEPRLAWRGPTNAAGRGLTLEQSKGELFNGRDLSKKGSRRRQVEYAETDRP